MDTKLHILSQVIKDSLRLTYSHGAFCVWAQPMRDDVALSHRPSLAEPIHKMIPDAQIFMVSKKTDLKGDITHCGLVMSVILAHFVSGNDLLPIWCQVITWTSAILISIRTWRPNFNLILIKFWTFSFKKIHLKLSSAKWLPFFSNSVLRIMKNNNSYCQVACQAAFVIKGGWEYWYLSAYITTEW